MADTEDRTEAPTSRRLERAREEGNVPVSREVGPAVALAGIALLLWLMGLSLPGLAQLAGLLRRALGPDSDAVLLAAPRAAMMCVLAILAPLFLLTLLASVLPVLAQTRFLLHGGALLPNLARINPSQGLARVFGPSSLFSVLRGVAKVTVFLVLAWHGVGPGLRALPRAMVLGLPAALGQGVSVLTRILFTAALVEGVGAGLDLFLTRRRHHQGLRMSRDEIRQESREANGNPEIKARIRRLRAQRARRRLAQAVQQATVVVTNPTHYAVALAYDQATRAAPRVVAKGMDEMAARIRALAEANNVPLVANPPLARALHRVELDAEIPAELYKAVAELIAYVWRLQGKARR